MKRTVCLLLCAVLLTLCLSGCVVINFNPSAMVTGEGEPARFEYTVGAFTEVTTDMFCEIHYYAADSDTVTLDIEPNFEERVSVTVKDGKLVVQFSKTPILYGSMKTPVLTISTPELTRLDIMGACSFIPHDPITADSFTLNLDGAGSGSAEIDVTHLSVNIAGAGSFTLSGTADTAHLRLDGAGSLDALSLQTRDAQIDLAGIGAISLSCTERLRIDADGLGTVKYKGSPSMEVNSDGLTSIQKVD